MSRDDFISLYSKFSDGEFVFSLPNDEVKCSDKLKFVAIASLLPICCSAFMFLTWILPPFDEDFHGSIFVVIPTLLLTQIIIVCLAFSSKEYGIDLQKGVVFVRQKCFAKMLWTRSFNIVAGASIGVGVLGLRNQFEHTLYLINGRRRWKFFTVQYGVKIPRSEFLAFCDLLSGLLSIPSNGYSLPFRFYIY